MSIFGGPSESGITPLFRQTLANSRPEPQVTQQPQLRFPSGILGMIMRRRHAQGLPTPRLDQYNATQGTM